MSVTRRDALCRTVALAALLTATFWPSLAQGQAPAGYPNKPIRFIVPYAPGGFPDTVARILAQRLSDRFGQSVIIAARPVKLIATNAAQRWSLAPDLPAISELVPGFDFAWRPRV